MLDISIRQFDDDYREEFKVTNPEPLDNALEFSLDGIFSSKIFGLMGNGIDYSCNCGELTGEFNLGLTCKKCNSPVEYKGLVIAKEGWIDLQYPCIHPIMYQYLTRIIGATTLKNIINYSGRTNSQGIIIEPEFTYPYTGIGMSKFLENFYDILNEFFDKKGAGKGRHYEYQFIKENEDAIIITKLPVINSKLRPAIVLNGEYQFDVINNFYNHIVKNIATLNDMVEIEKSKLVIEGIIFHNQNAIMDIYNNLVDNLGAKDGFIRGSLLGNRFNFSSRSVIVPLPKGYSMDDIIIPYHTGLELLKPVIINRIVRLKNCSIQKALEIINKGSFTFSELIYKIMCDIIKSDNIGVILDRNPTITVGSILFLRIAGIKKDLDDKTLSVNNLILASNGGDYDGDVLSLILIMSKKYCKMFRQFAPSNLVLDPDSGIFSGKFKPAKDIVMGLELLFSK